MRKTTLKVTATFFLALTSTAVSASHGTSITVVSPTDECKEFWFPNGVKRCGSPISSSSGDSRQTLPQAPVPAKRPEISKSADKVATEHKTAREDATPSLSSSDQAASDTSRAHKIGERQVDGESAAAISVLIEKSTGPSRAGPASAVVGSGPAVEQLKQVQEGENPRRGSGGGESQNQGRATPSQVTRDNDRDMSRAPVQSVVLVTGEENAQETTRNDLDNQVTENRTNYKNGALKRHAVMLSAALNLIYV
ncbi:expression site-associated gene 9 (ESAG9) protein, putative [Trypanosoma equiperdum]|uniref:Expression site-associated gene 9 (ESAG9) protein, putative n=1 Tax=Trypanosoma equiperdum TaxID=5694 RepID=A0A1G4IJ15_TRYEQ|nr:expression site-associated gene 9 (ESAG9) protein, putative [Trypanosoma equiperdum]